MTSSISSVSNTAPSSRNSNAVTSRKASGDSDMDEIQSATMFGICSPATT